MRKIINQMNTVEMNLVEVYGQFMEKGIEDYNFKEAVRRLSESASLLDELINGEVGR